MSEFLYEPALETRSLQATNQVRSLKPPDLAQYRRGYYVQVQGVVKCSLVKLLVKLLGKSLGKSLGKLLGKEIADFFSEFLSNNVALNRELGG